MERVEENERVRETKTFNSSIISLRFLHAASDPTTSFLQEVTDHPASVCRSQLTHQNLRGTQGEPESLDPDPGFQPTQLILCLFISPIHLCPTSDNKRPARSCIYTSGQPPPAPLISHKRQLCP